MLTGYDANVRNYCNVSDMRFGCSAWANKKIELNKHFLNNRFWFKKYTMTIPPFSVAHALWMPKAYALLGDRSARAVSGSVLITVNKPLCISTYLNINLQSWKAYVRLWTCYIYLHMYKKAFLWCFFSKQILRYSILFQELKRLVKKS